MQSTFKADITHRIKFIQTFGATLTSQDAGLYAHHAVSTLEFEIKRHLDLNVSFIWDYLKDPKTDSSGVVPQHSHYRLIVGRSEVLTDSSPMSSVPRALIVWLALAVKVERPFALRLHLDCARSAGGMALRKARLECAYLD
jgi:hypothetical protein